MKQQKKNEPEDFQKQLKHARDTSAGYMKELHMYVNAEKEKAKQFQQELGEKIKLIYRKTVQQYALNDEQDLTIPVDGQLERGSRIYTAQCAKCHSLDVASSFSTKKGPTLGLIYNRKVGSDINYVGYSEGMLKSNLYWGTKNLYKFLQNPLSLFPDTQCKFGEVGTSLYGLSSQEDRADLLIFFEEYSRELSKNILLREVKEKGYAKYQTDMYANEAEKKQKQRYQNAT